MTVKKRKGKGEKRKGEKKENKREKKNERREKEIGKENLTWNLFNLDKTTHP